MKSSKTNIFLTALFTTVTLAIVTQPNLIEQPIGNLMAKNLSSLNSK